MKHNIICEKCGHEMIDLSKGPYIEIKCPHCGWGWATYDASREAQNNTHQPIVILPNQYSREKASSLAHLLGISLIEAKRLLSEGGSIMVKSPNVPGEIKKANIEVGLK